MRSYGFSVVTISLIENETTLPVARQGCLKEIFLLEKVINSLLT